MCLIGIAIEQFSDYPLIVVANRDEFHQRETAPLGRWMDVPGIVAGKDLEGGGTWLGASSSGRIAMLTNLRSPLPVPKDAPSRGELPLAFLRDEDTPAEDWLDHLQENRSRYAGFNLVVGDIRNGLWLISSVGPRLAMGAGIHAISNGLPGEDWPKVRGLRADFSQITDPTDIETLFTLLDDTTTAPEHLLPETHFDRHTERWLSARRIVGEEYGTRASTLLRLDHWGRIDIIERTRDVSGAVISEKRELVKTL